MAFKRRPYTKKYSLHIYQQLVDSQPMSDPGQVVVSGHPVDSSTVVQMRGSVQQEIQVPVQVTIDSIVVA